MSDVRVRPDSTHGDIGHGRAENADQCDFEASGGELDRRSRRSRNSPDGDEAHVILRGERCGDSIGDSLGNCNRRDIRDYR